jgi:hypothetical protein
MNGLQSQFGCGSERKSPCPCRESNPSHPAKSVVTILTDLPPLLFVKQKKKIQNTATGDGSNVCHEYRRRIWAAANSGPSQMESVTRTKSMRSSVYRKADLIYVHNHRHNKAVRTFFHHMK